MTTASYAGETDEGAALTAVLDGDEDEAVRLIGQMSPGQRQLLAEYADRLAVLARHYEPPSTEDGCLCAAPGCWTKPCKTRQLRAARRHG